MFVLHECYRLIRAEGAQLVRRLRCEPQATPKPGLASGWALVEKT